MSDERDPLSASRGCWWSIMGGIILYLIGLMILLYWGYVR